MQKAQQRDILAGIALAAVLIPSSIAYAGIAGMPPAAGLVATFVGALVYGLAGRSPSAVIATTSSSALIVFLAKSQLRLTDGMVVPAVAAMVMAAGLLFVGLSFLRRMNISDFIAQPVLRGYTMGLSLIIIGGQLPKLTGYTGDPWYLAVVHSGQALLEMTWPNGPELLAGLAGLLVLTLTRRSGWPMMFILLAGSVIGNMALDGWHLALPMIGNVSLAFSGFPLNEAGRLGELPWQSLLEYAAVIALVLYAESVVSLKGSADRYGIFIDINREVRILGVCNMASALVGGLPVGAGLSQTAANEEAGAMSRWSALIAAVTLLLTVFLLERFIAYLPLSMLAAIVIYSVGGLLNPALVARYFKWKTDRLLVLISFCGVLVLGVQDGLLLAVAASVASLLRSLSRSRVALLGRLGDSHDYVNIRRFPAAQLEEELIILRADEPLFFGNAERMFQTVRQLVTKRLIDEADKSVKAADGQPLQAILLSLEESPALDSTAVEALENFVSWCRDRGLTLHLCRVKTNARDVLRRAEVNGLGMVSPRSVDWCVEHLHEAYKGQ